MSVKRRQNCPPALGKLQVSGIVNGQPVFSGQGNGAARDLFGGFFVFLKRQGIDQRQGLGDSLGQ